MSADQLKRSIREGARRQQGTFDVPSYISIGDPYKDGSAPSHSGRWTKPHHSAGTVLPPARPEDAGPPVPPFLAGAQLTRFDDTVATARWRRQIEIEAKANQAQDRLARLPPFALHDPEAYVLRPATAPAPATRAAMQQQQYAPWMYQQQSAPQPAMHPMPMAPMPMPGYESGYPQMPMPPMPYYSAAQYGAPAHAAEQPAPMLMYYMPPGYPAALYGAPAHAAQFAQQPAPMPMYYMPPGYPPPHGYLPMPR
ncbi:hypothetical protein T492DRAFT_983680 [Pavlovales sp. CCMP2436]|nr:hypothetical protein T492DRAFT_983680 [Pavlovales sp. CCMP2436]